MRPCHAVSPLIVTAEHLALRDDVASLINGKFVISADEVGLLMKRHPTASLDQVLFSFIQPAAKLARPPVSNYHVGAAGLAASGNIYLGVNLELRGFPLNNSIHAEQFLAVSLQQAKEERLVSLAVSAAPCGHCRQFYAELVHSDDIRFLFGDQEPITPRKLDDLLPLRFGPRDLIPDGNLFLQPQYHDLRLTKASEVRVGKSGCSLFRLASDQALMEARNAYAPYTLCPAGASIILYSGKVFSGGSIESAAYNPSLSPFHTAYIAACVGGMKSLGEIKEIVLVEKWGAKVSYENTIKLIMKDASRWAPLTRLGIKK